MRNRIIALAGGEALLVAGGLWLTGQQDVPAASPSLLLFVAYALSLTGLALAPRVYVELKRHSCWITPADCMLMVGLFAFGPFGFLAAAMTAEVVIAFRFRQPAVKSLFNLVSMLGGFVAATTTFALLGRTDPLDPVAWLCAVAALAAVTAWDVLSTSAVFAIAERQPFPVMLLRVGPPLLFSMALSAVLGLVALILFYETAIGPLLFAPVLGVLMLSTRSLSRQRAERVRFEQLYEASSNLARLVSMPDMLAMVATEARSLATGAVAMCCTTRADGSWTGMLVDDRGTHEAPRDVVGALARLTGDADHGEMVASALDRSSRDVLPDFSSMVWAVKQAQPSGAVLVAVFRDLPPDEQDQVRSDVLSAFVAHAATAVANVGLHAEVRESLQRQVELNQQKSDFVASVSHELRTPLTALIGSVQTMKRLGDRLPAADRTTMLDLGLTQGARLRGLIDDLLLVAAADHRAVQRITAPVVISDLLASVHAELNAATGDRLRLSCSSEVTSLETDGDKLRRILVNFIVNAGKYAPEGPIEVSAGQQGRELHISVEDSGPGIAERDRERVFERFVQLDQSATRRQGGTGLGLHLCRQLAHVLGATIRLDDAPTGGSRFTLVLPGDATRVHPATSSPQGAPARRLPAGMTRSPFARPAPSTSPPARLEPAAVAATSTRGTDA